MTCQRIRARVAKSCDMRCLCAMVAARIPPAALIHKLCVDVRTVEGAMDPAQIA